MHTNSKLEGWTQPATELHNNWHVIVVQTAESLKLNSRGSFTLYIHLNIGTIYDKKQIASFQKKNQAEYLLNVKRVEGLLRNKRHLHGKYFCRLGGQFKWVWQKCWNFEAIVSLLQMKNLHRLLTPLLEYSFMHNFPSRGNKVDYLQHKNASVGALDKL